MSRWSYIINISDSFSVVRGTVKVRGRQREEALPSGSSRDLTYCHRWIHSSPPVHQGCFLCLIHRGPWLIPTHSVLFSLPSHNLSPQMVCAEIQSSYIPNIIGHASPCLCDSLHLSKHQLRDWVSFMGAAFCLKFPVCPWVVISTRCLAIGRWREKKSKWNSVRQREGSWSNNVIIYPRPMARIQ